MGRLRSHPLQQRWRAAARQARTPRGTRSCLVRALRTRFPWSDSTPSACSSARLGARCPPLMPAATARLGRSATWEDRFTRLARPEGASMRPARATWVATQARKHHENGGGSAHRPVPCSTALSSRTSPERDLSRHKGWRLPAGWLDRELAYAVPTFGDPARRRNAN
jgi:hypothetical protein